MADSRTRLIACSICLRVQKDSEWIEADRIIRQIRSYELDVLPRLEAALCPRCSAAIAARRARAIEPLAA